MNARDGSLGEAGARLRALVATWRRIAVQHREQDGLVGAYSHNSCADELEAELDALRSAPVVSPPQEEVIVDAYQKAQELWSSQCFCFTSAPETVRRAAHEVARDGFNELVGILGPLARPVLDAEYRAAEAEAKKAAAPVVTQEGEEPCP